MFVGIDRLLVANYPYSLDYLGRVVGAVLPAFNLNCRLPLKDIVLWGSIWPSNLANQDTRQRRTLRTRDDPDEGNSNRGN
jgi:hypothetical protein